MPGEASDRRGVDRRLLTESIVIMIFATAMFAVTFTFDHVPAILAQGIQPTVFPRVVLIIMFVLAALQAGKACRLSPADLARLKPHAGVPAIVFFTVAALVVFLVAMPVMGTFPTLILFCPALACLWGERRWVMMALSFTGFIAFVYLLFRVTMNVPLP